MLDNYFKNLISLRENEEIETVIHYHLFTFSADLIKISLIPLVSFVIIYFIGISNFIALFDSVWFPYIALIIFIVWGTYSIYTWAIWYLDTAIITNERIIVAEQKSLFERFVSEANLDKIQDITVSVKGILPTILKYGSVIVQTAGETNNLIIRNVSMPGKIQSLILKLKDSSSKEQLTTDS